MTIKNGMRPAHPGEVLREDFMLPLGLDVAGLAARLQLEPVFVQAMVDELSEMTPAFAERIVSAFGGDVQSWLNLQTAYYERAPLKPPHPGSLLRRIIEEQRLTPATVARAIGVPVDELNDIVLERRGISPDMALRLSAYFAISEPFWSNLQSGYDRRIAGSAKAMKVFVEARLVNGSIMDFEFGGDFLDKLAALQSQGYAGKELIHALITDDWGPPPRFVRIKATTDSGELIEIDLDYT